MSKYELPKGRIKSETIHATSSAQYKLHFKDKSLRIIIKVIWYCRKHREKQNTMNIPLSLCWIKQFSIKLKYKSDKILILLIPKPEVQCRSRLKGKVNYVDLPCKNCHTCNTQLLAYSSQVVIHHLKSHSPCL